MSGIWSRSTFSPCPPLSCGCCLSWSSSLTIGVGSLHFNVTEHPTAAWTAQQIVDTFADDTAPAYLLRDRDAIYGDAFRQRVNGMRIGEVLTAARSPWWNPFAERLIGSICGECLNHVLVLSECHLRDILTGYVEYYHRTTCLPRMRRSEAGRAPELAKSCQSASRGLH